MTRSASATAKPRSVLRASARFEAIEAGRINVVGYDVNAGERALKGDLRAQHADARHHDACDRLIVGWESGRHE